MRKLGLKDARELFLDGAVTLAQIEANGMRVDTAYLDKTITEIDARVASARAEMKQDPVYREWRKRYGDKMKWDATEQLAVVMKGLGHPVVGETAGGKQAADEAAFARVDHLFVKTYFEIKKIGNAKRTWLEGVRRELVGGVLRPHFNLASGGGGGDDKGGARSYRSSQSDPNCQNWPNRNPDMERLVRPLLIPRPGHCIVEIDMKGAEVRVGYCYHQDPQMFTYLTDPRTDMHRDMAEQIFCLRRDQVGKKLRNEVKANFVFAQFYGSYYIQCAAKIWDALEIHGYKTEDGVPVLKELRRAGVTGPGAFDPRADNGPETFVHHVKKIEEDFWGRRFRGYAAWRKRRWEEYRRDGYFEYLTGFRAEGEFSKNQITNYPIQGSSFHCLLWSLIRLHRWLVRRRMKSMIIGQIHDSILADVRLGELQAFVDKAVEVSTVLLPKEWDWITVPLEVEVEAAPPGASWYEKEPWHKGEEGLWLPSKN